MNCKRGKLVQVLVMVAIGKSNLASVSWTADVATGTFARLAVLPNHTGEPGQLLKPIRTMLWTLHNMEMLSVCRCVFRPLVQLRMRGKTTMPRK